MKATQHRRSGPRQRGRRARLAAGTALVLVLAGGAQSGCGPATEEVPPPSGEASPDSPAELWEGAWFTIEVPPGFTVRPSLASETAEGYDSAFFASADGRAVFYVCSPQWGREATDVALDPASETLISARTVEIGELSVERLEIEARDGSYRRQLENVVSPAAGARWTFGFRWADERAQREHRERYERFKASLEQYAD